MKRVKGVEEFLLGTLLAADKLNVVHQQDVGVSVLMSELGHLGLSEAFDKLVRKVVALYVADNLGRIILFDLVSDSVEQVGLAESGVSVQKQRIIGVRRICRYGETRGVGEFVGRADNSSRLSKKTGADRSFKRHVSASSDDYRYP